MRRGEYRPFIITADAWNALCPEGTAVRYWPVRGSDEYLDTKTRSRAWELGHGAPVVSIEGVTGGVLIEHLSVLPPPPADEPAVVPVNATDYGLVRVWGSIQGGVMTLHAHWMNVAAELKTAEPAPGRAPGSVHWRTFYRSSGAELRSWTAASWEEALADAGGFCVAMQRRLEAGEGDDDGEP